MYSTCVGRKEKEESRARNVIRCRWKGGGRKEKVGGRKVERNWII